MSALVAPDVMPALRTIANVQLISVGVWQASTGECEFTKEDLASIIAALDDPAIHEPRLRIGHTAASATADASAGGFDEQPAFGRFTNLRLEAGGATIVADAVGVPAWLAEILPTAFPSRSIEAYWGYTTHAGRSHECVLTSVALLGVSMPACETLEDLQVAFGAEIPAGVEFSFLKHVQAHRGGAMPERTSASVTYSDVRRSFYEDVANEESDRYWWWLTDLIVSPSTAIADADDGTGTLWSVPYKIGKDDTITWSDPVEVRIQYVEVKSGKVAASAPDPGADLDVRAEYAAVATGQRLSGAPLTPVFTAAASRPNDRVRAAQPPQRSNHMDGAQLRTLLGMPEDATDDQVSEKLAAQKTDADKAATLETENASLKAAAENPTALDGTATLDAATLEQLKADAHAGREALAAQVKARQTTKVDAAIKLGKLIPARRDHYLSLMSSDEEGTTAFIDKLEGGLVPVKERGTTGDEVNEGSREGLVNTAMHGLGFGHLVASGKESK